MASFARITMDENDEETMKVVIVGDSGTPCSFCLSERLSGVGKTSLLMRFLNEKFITEHQITIGVEFGSKTINLPGENPIQMQIWDTAGQEKFRSLVQSFYRGAQVVFLVYSVCKYNSPTQKYRILFLTRFPKGSLFPIIKDDSCPLADSCVFPSVFKRIVFEIRMEEH